MTPIELAKERRKAIKPDGGAGRQWAERLRQRELAGDKTITDFQRKAWRQAVAKVIGVPAFDQDRDAEAVQGELA